VTRVAALVPDLFFASKVEATLRAAGHDVTIVSSPAEVPGDAEVLIVDLDAPDALTVAATVPRLGFYSHVDVETRRRAEEAGFELVVPRSRMARDMPDLVARLVVG
jgi:hypothetical protein